MSREFIFQSDVALDMRINQEQDLTVKNILNTYKPKALSNIFYHYGDFRKIKFLFGI